MNISAIHKLAPEQLIAVKAKVVSISGVKSLKTLYGTLMKQDVNVADTTAHIKLVLWEQFVNTLALNNTYNIKNARVKVANYERYLNSPRNDDFSTAKAVDCATQVVQYQEDLGTTIHATILGDQTATKTLACVNCQRHNVSVTSPSKAVCQSYKSIQLYLQIVQPIGPYAFY